MAGHTVMVVGAGASLAEAIARRPKRSREHPPLDATLFQRAARYRPSPTLREVVRQARQIGEPNLTSAEHPVSLESYLGRLYFNVNHNPRAARVHAYFDAVLLYTWEIIATTNWMMGKPGLMKKILRREADRCDRLSLLTFNIDLLLENALQLLAGSRPAIPWCLEKAYGLPSDVNTGSLPGDEFDWSGAATEIPLYKMHGSVNWVFKHRDKYPPATLVRGASEGRDMWVIRNKVLPSGQMSLRTPRGQRNWYLFPLIVPPVYEKHALIRGDLQQVWDKATAALEEATRVIFWGYSFPAADTHARHFFQGLAQSNSALRRPILINPDSAAAAALWGVLRPTRVQHYRTADDFLAE